MRKFPLYTWVFLFGYIFLSCSDQELRESFYCDSLNKREKFYVIETENGGFLKDGEYKRWFEDKQISVSGSYKTGKKTGLWEEWRHNGLKKSEIRYVDDVEHGFQRRYYKNGQVDIEGEMKNGKKQSTWSYYGEKGNLQRKLTYDQDEDVSFVGIWKINDGSDYIQFKEDRTFTWYSNYTAKKKFKSNSPSNPFSGTLKHTGDYDTKLYRDRYNYILDGYTVDIKSQKCTDRKWKEEYLISIPPIPNDFAPKYSSFFGKLYWHCENSFYVGFIDENKFTMGIDNTVFTGIRVASFDNCCTF